MLTKSITNKNGVENDTTELRNTICTDLYENKCVSIAAQNDDDEHQKSGGDWMHVEGEVDDDEYVKIMVMLID